MSDDASLTVKHLRERLDYDPDAGVFTWKPRLLRPGHERTDKGWNTQYAGQPAGGVWLGQYIQIRINGRWFKAHRLAFLYMAGSFPKNEVDHVDGNGLNNKWENLREATRAQNCQNRASSKRGGNAVGMKGVKRMPDGKFQARISNQGKYEHLGTFDSAEEAHASYCCRAKVLHGAFARTG